MENHTTSGRASTSANPNQKLPEGKKEGRKEGSPNAAGKEGRREVQKLLTRGKEGRYYRPNHTSTKDPRTTNCQCQPTAEGENISLQKLRKIYNN